MCSVQHVVNTLSGPDSMPITVVCDDCSTTLRVRDEAAGRKVRCKSCGGVVAVPDPDVDDGFDDFAPSSPPRSAPKRKSKGRSSRKRPREMTQKVKEGVLGLGVGALLHLVFSLFGWVNLAELDSLGFVLTMGFTVIGIAGIVCAILLANRVPFAHPLSVICSFLFLFAVPIGTVVGVIALRALYSGEMKRYLGIR